MRRLARLVAQWAIEQMPPLLRIQKSSGSLRENGRTHDEVETIASAAGLS
jgi:hypothetical protein